MIILYSLVLAIFGIYSYALMDPNITFFQSNVWARFRDWIIMFGYYHRDNSTYVYVGTIIMLFLFQYLILTRLKKNQFIPLLIVVSVLGVLSYPFLSHDLFNYLFDAKILTFYHQNPYLHKALDFPHDPWIRFMHWTHRTYPYGPSFLPLSAIPLFLSFGKFLPAFLLYKCMNTGIFIISALALHKLHKKAALFYITSPLLIVEGLMNAHNDMLGLSLAIIGIYLLMHSTQTKGRIVLLLSGLIKYITLPTLFISPVNYRLNKVLFIMVCGLLGYLCWTSEIQGWYFLSLLIFLPFFYESLIRISFFTAGLLFAYIPYIRFGGWDKQFEVAMKHQIILVFFVINACYLIYYAFSLRRHTQDQ